MKDYQLDGNKEMVALGTMNIVGSMTSCYVATGKEEIQFSDLDRTLKFFDIYIHQLFSSPFFYVVQVLSLDQQ